MDQEHQQQESLAATYEARKAQEWNRSQADRIAWNNSLAFRNENYRQLFHQRGLIGTFRVRLLEAADLKRSYWSALALGPLRNLGLSKAHGGVSSFVSFVLDTTPDDRSKEFEKQNKNNSSIRSGGGGDRKPPARKLSGSKGKVSNPLHLMPSFVSPVVQQDSNPVWNNTAFDLPLEKGTLDDGQSVRIFLRVDEEATTIENLVPGIPSSGGDARLLGVGRIDVTSLCLGQTPCNGRPESGVIDAWVPITLPEDDDDDDDDGSNNGSDNMTGLTQQELVYNATFKNPKELAAKQRAAEEERRNKVMGRVRVLVTYESYGLTPQQGDVVALEAFARQDPRRTTCQPILPSLLPLHVLEVSEPWLLVEYTPLVHTSPSEGGGGGVHGNGGNNRGPSKNTTTACLRLHRNSVFVVERKNLLDAALNVALQPVDAIVSTPIGHASREILGPVFVATKQLLMPALLSSKLVWLAVRTTALASFTGVTAAGSAFVQEGTSSLTRDDGRIQTRKAYDENGKTKYVSL